MHYFYLVGICLINIKKAELTVLHLFEFTNSHHNILHKITVKDFHCVLSLFLTLVVTETTGSVSGLSITSELNDELNDLIQRFHNQLQDSQVRQKTTAKLLQYPLMPSRK